MTPEEYAAKVSMELAARNADIPFAAILLLELKTWPPGGPKITPRHTADVWFQLRFVISMTAAEWDAAADPSPMLTRVRFHASDEQFTHFACACCRRVWDLMPGEDVRQIVEATEDVLRGKLGREARDEFFDVLTEPFMESISGAAKSAALAAGELFELGYYAALGVSLHAAEARAGGSSEGPAYAAEQAAQATLLRELLGNPLRSEHRPN